MADPSSHIQWGSPERRAQNRGPLLYIICSVFNSLSLIGVLLRLYTRKAILNKLQADDFTIILAETLSIGVSITTCIRASSRALGTHVEFIPASSFSTASKALFATLLIYNAAQIVTKISLLVQHKRVFAGQWLQRICVFALAFVSLWGILQVFITAFSCSPLQRTETPWRARCLSSPAVFKVNSIMNIVTDFLIICIPIPPVLQLHMSIRQKSYLLCVFSLGFFACSISIIRLNELYKVFHSVDPPWDGVPIEYWSVIELNIGILCACLATLNPLYKKFSASIRQITSGKGSYGSSTNKSGSKRFSIRNKRAMELGISVEDSVEISSITELRSVNRERADVPHTQTEVTAV